MRGGVGGWRRGCGGRVEGGNKNFRKKLIFGVLFATLGARGPRGRGLQNGSMDPKPSLGPARRLCSREFLVYGVYAKLSGLGSSGKFGEERSCGYWGCTVFCSARRVLLKKYLQYVSSRWERTNSIEFVRRGLFFRGVVVI